MTTFSTFQQGLVWTDGDSTNLAAPGSIVGTLVGEYRAAPTSIGNADAILPSWADGASDS